MTFLTDLWVASWREAMPEIDFERRRDWIATFLRDPAHATLVAEGPAGPLGFATLDGGRLHQFVVATEVKGDGTATHLLDALKRHAADGLTLDVNQANARAVGFYTREGFAITGAGKNPASGLAIWHMTWRITWTRGGKP